MLYVVKIGTYGPKIKVYGVNVLILGSISKLIKKKLGMLFSDIYDIFRVNI